MCQHYFFKFIKNVWRCGGADLASKPIPQSVRSYTPSTVAASLLAAKKLGAKRSSHGGRGRCRPQGDGYRNDAARAPRRGLLAIVAGVVNGPDGIIARDNASRITNHSSSQSPLRARP